MLTLNDNLRDASCKNLPEKDKRAFFTRPNNEKEIERSKRVCRTCPVRSACLEDVLSFEVAGERLGVWGGLSALERDQLFGAAEVSA